MATTKQDNKLIELRPTKGLDSGLTPSILPSSGAVWKTGQQVWFQEAHIEKAPGETRIIGQVQRKSRGMAQAFVDGKARLYYENLGVISYYEDVAGSVLIDAGTTPEQVDMVPWGTWLAMTDNVDPPKLWKGTGGFIDIGAPEFTKAKMLRKLGQYLIALSTDTFPSGYHWSAASDPETWEPTQVNTAGNSPIRDLDSDLMAAADLGAGLAIYSREYMLVVQYVGWPDIFGTPNQALSGIGAVSKGAVVSRGRENWGLSRGGIWATDGSSFAYVDRPAVSRWLQEFVDWDRAEEVTSYYDEQLLLVVWSVPTLGGAFAEIAVDPTRKVFTYLGDGFGAALERGVFNYPLVAKTSGIYLRSVFGVNSETQFQLKSQLWDAQSQFAYKAWNYMLVEGEWDDTAEIRIGFTNEADLASVAWNAWQPLTYRLPFGPREAVFMAIELRADNLIKLAALTVFGDMAGPVG